MNKRSLRLRRETLSGLDTDELGRMAGGTHLTCNTCTAQVTHDLCEVPQPQTLNIRDCLTLQASCRIPCPTRDHSCIC